MAEYIEREYLIKRLKKRYNDPNYWHAGEDWRMGLSLAKDIVDEAPACYVVEVRHGRWEEHFAYGSWHYDCPFCDNGYATIKRDDTPPNYCQDCGAKMDGKGKDDA